ncbi:MAG: NAD(P)-dependent oxidoreductase [Victivallales bacterium]
MPSCEVRHHHISCSADPDGSDATFHLADRSFFERASKQPFLDQLLAREVVDNAALKEALKNEKLRGAALDVWENEPEIHLGLLNLLDYATPHIAGYSADGKANGTSMSVNALASFFALPLYEFEPYVPAGRSVDQDSVGRRFGGTARKSGLPLL